MWFSGTKKWDLSRFIKIVVRLEIKKEYFQHNLSTQQNTTISFRQSVWRRIEFNF